jgi:hypothetical protein
MLLPPEFSCFEELKPVLWITFMPRPSPRLMLAHATALFTTFLHHPLPVPW